MGYEGQIAGLADAPPGHPVKAQLIRFIQARSVRELNQRRAEAIRLIQDVTRLEFVNGGGTGSPESTARDSSVTELTAGSGLVGPTLFDAYTRFRPEQALLFALPVVAAAVGCGTAAAILVLSPTWPAALVAAPLLGAGFGTYWAAAPAVLTAVLPAASDRAKDLGVINVAYSLPLVVAPVVAGVVLGLMHSYPSLFAVACLASFAAAVAITRVRSVR